MAQILIKRSFLFWPSWTIQAMLFVVICGFCPKLIATDDWSGQSIPIAESRITGDSSRSPFYWAMAQSHQISSKNRPLVQMASGVDHSLSTRTNHTQNKPWYFSGSALFLYVLVASIIIYYLYHFIRSKQKALEDEAVQLREKLTEASTTLANQKEKLEQFEDYKSEFFASVTHELRTPLTVSLGTIELLRKKKTLSSDESRLLDTIETNNQRLLTAINQLLDASHLQAIKKQGIDNGKTVELCRFTKSCLEPFLSLAKKDAIELNFFPCSAPAYILLEEEQFKRIISNLMFNALSSTPSGGEIEVKIRIINNTVCLSVRDSGRGYSAEEKPHIFEQFFANKIPDKYRSQNAEINLAMVKTLVTLHQGNIEVVDNNTNGACFELSFPLAHHAENVSEEGGEAQKSHHSTQDPAPEATTHGDADTEEEDTRRKILVIDDNEEIGILLGEIFEPEYRVICAFDGKAGLEQAKAEIPDLILCDLRMPEMDGMEVTKAIKNDIDLATIPLIMLTASHSPEDELKSLQLEATDFISKPFSTAKLYQKVVNQITLQARWREQADKVKITKEAEESRAKEPDNADEKEAIYQEEGDKNSVWLNNLRARLVDHISEIQSINDLAKFAYMDRSNLYRKLQTSLGETPQIFLKNVRLEAAEDAVRNTSNSISAIAYHCGFSNLSSFSRAFKQKFGMSPNQYRADVKT